MKSEHEIQNEIRIALSKDCIIFRVNVGTCHTKDGRFFKTGVPKGFPDLFGVRKTDGKAVFIEVKNANGRPSEEQMNFIEKMRSVNAVAGICRSVEDAMNLIKEEN